MLSSDRKNFFKLLAATILLISWELVVRLNIINAQRVPYPSGIIQILMKPAFILRFFLTVLLAAIGTLISGLIVTKMISRFVTRETRISNLLETGRFFPLILAWALPFWPLQVGTRDHPFLWTLVILTMSVTLFLLYTIALARNSNLIDRNDLRFKIWHSTIHYSGFLSIVIQPWIVPYSWLFFSPKETFLRPSVLATAILLYAAFSVILKFVFGASFEREVATHVRSVKQELEEDSRIARLPMALSLVAIVVLWQFLSSIGFKSALSSPLDVSTSIYFHLIRGTPLTYWPYPVIEELSASILKVVLGLSTGVALVHMILGRASIPNFYRSLLYYGRFYIALLGLDLIYIIGFRDFWITVSTIGLVVLYPSLKTAWGFRHYPPICRLLLSVKTALPFAFIILLFAESINATQGIGLLVLYSNARWDVSNAIAGIFVWFFVLQMISSTIGYAAKRNWNTWHREAGEIVVPR